MKSVKEMADTAGVSVRTLHYYDEIGLLKPSYVTPAGYRQYSNADIIRLQKIFLLKEVGFRLADIKKIIENKDSDIERYVFEKQKELLILKKNRLDDLIQLIASIMKGERTMFFEMFSKTEIDDTFKAMMQRLNEEETKEYLKKSGGSMEEAQKSFEESFMSYDGDLKHYLGDKDMSTVIKESPGFDEIEKSREILTGLYRKLSERNGNPIDDTVLSIIGEIRKVTISMFPIDKQDDLFKEMAELYANNKNASDQFNEIYGKGSADYYYKCVKEFYNSMGK